MINWESLCDGKVIVSPHFLLKAGEGGEVLLGQKTNENGRNMTGKISGI